MDPDEIPEIVANDGAGAMGMEPILSHIVSHIGVEREENAGEGELFKMLAVMMTKVGTGERE